VGSIESLQAGGQLVATVSGSSRCGQRLEAEVRSSRPAAPSSLKRHSHVKAVWRDTPMALAASPGFQPSISTRLTSNCLPSTVSFALA
jgi:hypothetical protein